MLPGRGIPMKKAPPPPNPLHFAMGTDSVPVPAPGQTVTNGSWTGPMPQPAPTPSPLGGQNQNLRQSLGMGVKRFASGTPDVNNDMRATPPVFSMMTSGQPGPNDVYDQAPTLPATNNGFATHLTAAMAPSGPQQAPQAAPSLPQNAGQGASAMAPSPQTMLAQLPQSAGALGKIHNFMFPDPAFAQKEALANFYQHPDVQAHLLSDPQALQAAVAHPDQFAPSLADYLTTKSKGGNDFSKIYHPDGTGQMVAKTPDNAHQIEVIANATGFDKRHIHGMLEPHQFSQQEFESSMADMPWAVAQHLWGMQHYLSPQQTAVPSYLGMLQQKSEAAKAAYTAAVQSGNGADATKAKSLADMLDNEFMQTQKAWGLGASTPYAMFGQQQ